MAAQATDAGDGLTNWPRWHPGAPVRQGRSARMRRGVAEATWLVAKCHSHEETSRAPSSAVCQPLDARVIWRASSATCATTSRSVSSMLSVA